MNHIVDTTTCTCILCTYQYCQLPSCNLFTQHVSYLLWIDTTSELWTPVHSFTLIKQPQTANCSFFILCNLILIFHTIRLILCFQQAGEIDNLTVKLGQSILIVLCRFHVGAGIPGVAPHYISPPSTFNVLLGSYWFDKPWFLTEGKLTAVRITPSSWGSQRTRAVRVSLCDNHVPGDAINYSLLNIM